MASVWAHSMDTREPFGISTAIAFPIVSLQPLLTRKCSAVAR
jgi:hypothetical protein